MTQILLDQNSHFLKLESDWVMRVLDRRFAVRSDNDDPDSFTELLNQPPTLPPTGSYSALLKRYSLGPAERLVVMLAMLPEIRPEALDPFLLHNVPIGRRFSEFGGIVGQNHNGFIPTVETALFLLAGDDLTLRLNYRPLFGPDSILTSKDIISLDHRQPGEPAQAAILRLSTRHLERVMTGHDVDPPPSADFPAHRLSSPLDWGDLVLDDRTRSEIDDISMWIRHEKTLMHDWMLQKRLKPGYRSLFYGPPGTGKTLTASLIGKATGLPVYRVDLSMIVSKWIGETEKNLARLFDQAEQQQWILFFDEAEALFGKRTETRSANDRSANQQISYLLQRIEDFPGVTILATNLRGNLDEAFIRRFQSIIMFRMPNAPQRLQLWKDMFIDQPFKVAEDVDLHAISEEFELAAGSIVNVLRFACLQAVRRDPAVVERRDIHDGIRAERQKESRSSN